MKADAVWFFVVFALSLIPLSSSSSAGNCCQNIVMQAEGDARTDSDLLTHLFGRWAQHHSCGGTDRLASNLQSSAGRLCRRQITSFTAITLGSYSGDLCRRGDSAANGGRQAAVVAPRPTAEMILLEEDCYHPDGSDCGWYGECLAKRFPCVGETNYAVDFGKKYCELFEENYDEFSANARLWIEAVKKCLQVELARFLLPSVNDTLPTCDDVKSAAFDSHVPCYVKPKASVCRLGLTDWWKIFWTIRTSFVDDFRMTSTGFVKIAGKCLGIW